MFVSDHARTLEIEARLTGDASTEELPPVTDQTAWPDENWDDSSWDDASWDDADREAEPTTLSIPLVTGAQPVVLDEPVAATRTIESLLLTTRRARLALLTLAVCAFAFGVNEASVVAMSADIAAGLNVSVASIGVLATAFALTVVAAALPLTVVTRRWSDGPP